MTQVKIKLKIVLESIFNALFNIIDNKFSQSILTLSILL